MTPAGPTTAEIEESALTREDRKKAARTANPSRKRGKRKHVTCQPPLVDPRKLADSPPDAALFLASCVLFRTVGFGLARRVLFL